MSIYVDNLKPCTPNHYWPLRSHCVLLADSTDELHKFAKRLSLGRRCFQQGCPPYYHLTPSKRQRAVRHGAVEIDENKVIELLHQAQRLQNAEPDNTNRKQ